MITPVIIVGFCHSREGLFPSFPPFLSPRDRKLTGTVLARYPGYSPRVEQVFDIPCYSHPEVQMLLFPCIIPSLC